MAQNLLRLDGYDKAGQKTDWFTVLAEELQSDATRTSGLFVARFALGLMLEVITANEAGAAGTFTPKILVPDGAGGADVVIVTFTAISANGTNILVLYPATMTDLGNDQKLGTLPREWKLELTYSGTPGTDKFDTTVYGRYI